MVVCPPVMLLEGNSRGNAEVVGVRARRRQATEGLINVRGGRRAWHSGINKSKSVSLPVYVPNRRALPELSCSRPVAVAVAVAVAAHKPAYCSLASRRAAETSLLTVAS